MPRLVILVRHGERKDDLAGAQPDPTGDPPLSEPGKLACEEEGKRLAQHLPADFSAAATNAAVFSSPFQRCRETAEAICRGGGWGSGQPSKGKPFAIDDDICEVFGPIRIKLPFQVEPPKPWQPGSMGTKPRWGETLNQAMTRFQTAFCKYLKNYSHHRVVLLITHGDALDAVYRLIYPDRMVYATQYLSSLVIRIEEDTPEPLPIAEGTGSPNTSPSSRQPHLVKAHLTLVEENGVQWIPSEKSGDYSSPPGNDEATMKDGNGAPFRLVEPGTVEFTRMMPIGGGAGLQPLRSTSPTTTPGSPNPMANTVPSKDEPFRLEATATPPRARDTTASPTIAGSPSPSSPEVSDRPQRDPPAAAPPAVCKRLPVAPVSQPVANTSPKEITPNLSEQDKAYTERGERPTIDRGSPQGVGATTAPRTERGVGASRDEGKETGPSTQVKSSQSTASQLGHKAAAELLRDHFKAQRALLQADETHADDVKRIEALKETVNRLEKERRECEELCHSLTGELFHVKADYLAVRESTEKSREEQLPPPPYQEPPPPLPIRESPSNPPPPPASAPVPSPITPAGVSRECQTDPTAVDANGCCSVQ